jgi:hypothetical protein
MELFKSNTIKSHAYLEITKIQKRFKMEINHLSFSFFLLSPTLVLTFKFLELPKSLKYLFMITYQLF